MDNVSDDFSDIRDDFDDNSQLENDSVTPDMLLSSGQVDEYCLTYEGTGTTFEWQACSIGGMTIGDIDTSVELAAILTDETGTGSVVFSASPTLTGILDAVAGDFSSTFTLSGTAANIELGSNWLSGDGSDEGIFVAGNGNVGVGTSIPSAGGTSANAGRTYLTIKGTTNSGVIQLTSSAADADSAHQGNVEWVDSNSSQADKRIAYIAAILSGATANNRGSYLAFGTRADNASGAIERLKITNNGDTILGQSGGTPRARFDIVGTTADNTAKTFNVRNVSSVDLFTILNGGNVGIGSSTPSSKLSVVGNSTFTGQLNLSGSAANIALGSNWLSGDGSDEGIFVAGNGNVGVGTNNPMAKLSIMASTTSTQSVPNTGSALHITGEDGVSVAMTFDAFGSDFFDSPYLTLRKANGTSASPGATETDDIIGNLQTFGYANGGFSIAGDIGFLATENWTSTARGSAISISYGRVGSTVRAGSLFRENGLAINKTAILPPHNSQLDLAASTLSATSWTTAGININSRAVTITDTTGSGAIGTRVGSSFGIPTFASTNAVTVNNAATLYVAGAPAAGANTLITTTHALHVAAGNSYFGGNVGMGTTTPAQRLQVLGNIRVGTSGSNGCIEDYGGGVIGGTCSSDENLKTNIEPLEQEGRSYLEGLAALTPVSYNWNQAAVELYRKDINAENLGLLAQDVEAQFPELVSVNSDGYKQVDFRALPFYILEALKELWEKVQGQDERLEELEEENQKLKERIIEIENELDIDSPQPTPDLEPTTEEPPVTEPVQNSEPTSEPTEPII